MSIGDVARGYRMALERQGHEMADYLLGQHMMYHQKAIPPEIFNPQILAHQASETIMNQALYNKVDLVLMISGLGVHPIALWLLSQVNIPVAIVFTESPYEDDQQKKWMDLSKVNSTANIVQFTNDRYSAIKYGWTFLPPSYDPAIHRPVEPDSEHACDVMMVGTGWPERQRLLEAVDWTGIDLKLYGLWLEVTPDSPLHKFYYPGVISNAHVPSMYNAAKINLNIHRESPVALTPGPRVFELAACGAFQLSDTREDLEQLFKKNIPTFTSAAELERSIRYYLAHPEERRMLAAGALGAVSDQHFDARAATLINTVIPTLSRSIK